MKNKSLVCLAVALWTLAPFFALAQQSPGPMPMVMPETLTPKTPATPRINGPKIFGVRPGAPLLYSIPATGDRPMSFSADNLPSGLSLDAVTGSITGRLKNAGEYKITLHARNILGTADKPFRIVVGDEIALTPPMGWNSWNCWHDGVDQDKIMRSTNGLVGAKLNQHGWTYMNIDDTWQGRRGGPFNAIQPDPKRFPDMKALSRQVHGLGLKLGLYSTPWATSYGGRVGGSSENPDGAWDPKTMGEGTPNVKVLPKAVAKYSFAKNDAQQWAQWGIDYLKYDYAPVEPPEVKEMAAALRATGRDIVLSMSNNHTGTLFKEIAEVSRYAQSWRTTTDISDTWASMSGIGFGQDKWAPYARPGHWNDPDMFEIGANGGGTPKRLTADEQYTHVSLWCLLSAPLLLGCDLEHLDDFTIGLVSNDEVLDIDQDALGQPATRVASAGKLYVYAKPLEDGAQAVGLFNTDETPAEITVKWSSLGLNGPQVVRDLWRQKTLGSFADQYSASVAPHGVVLVKIARLSKS